MIKQIKKPQVLKHTEIFVRGIPKETKLRFQAYAARRGKTMKALIMEFMQECIDNAPEGKD